MRHSIEAKEELLLLNGVVEKLNRSTGKPAGPR
jgi:hypothetical protein